MEVIWKKAVSTRFPELVHNIEVSNECKVRKIHNKKEYKITLHKQGYKLIMINAKEFPIHTLMAETFISPRPDNMIINHIDGDKLNNAISNLQYVTFDQSKSIQSVNRKKPVKEQVKSDKEEKKPKQEKRKSKTEEIEKKLDRILELLEQLKV